MRCTKFWIALVVASITHALAECVQYRLQTETASMKRNLGHAISVMAGFFAIIAVGALCNAFQHPILSLNRPRSSRLPVVVQFTLKNEQILSPRDYDTIQEGRIAVIPNFIPPQEIASLKLDAQSLWDQRQFATDALASYGESKVFDPARDRAVLKLSQWKDQSLGTYSTRQRLGARMAALRADLAFHLDRPHLNSGLATSQYGHGSTEISYTRFGPGAFLKRHVDEHHEELKDTAGWSQPTRRSVSWLIYLNNDDWNPVQDGGQLRCYPRAMPPITRVGARPNGDLQLAWLRPTPLDPVERPVFLNARRPKNKCAMYYMASSSLSSTWNDNENETREQYITPDFESHPILYLAGGEALVKKILLERHVADRFQFIEPPKSKLDDLFSLGPGSAIATNTQNRKYDDNELLADVSPVGGTLVLFDSVSLPHEVLPTKRRERWATSGWFHEDQQPPVGRRQFEV